MVEEWGEFPPFAPHFSIKEDGVWDYKVVTVNIQGWKSGNPVEEKLNEMSDWELVSLVSVDDWHLLCFFKRQDNCILTPEFQRLFAERGIECG